MTTKYVLLQQIMKKIEGETMVEKEKEVSEKELDEFIEGELKKDLTQEDKVDESVDEHLQQMGFLWDRMQHKLHNDKICFGCKKEINIENEKLHVIEASSVDKGVVAFVSICEECYDKQNKENEVKKNE